MLEPDSYFILRDHISTNTRFCQIGGRVWLVIRQTLTAGSLLLRSAGNAAGLGHRRGCPATEISADCHLTMTVL